MRSHGPYIARTEAEVLIEKKVAEYGINQWNPATWILVSFKSNEDFSCPFTQQRNPKLETRNPNKSEFEFKNGKKEI